MRVTVYGGSQPKEGSRAYAEARDLGEMLARQGHTVLTGGYTGTMEAVSRGAAEAGGFVVGVTCDEIAHSYGRAVNRWVTEERRRTTLLERLHSLIHDSDAALALPGGPGTLTEIALTWNMMIAGSIPARPLILIGESWRLVWGLFYAQLDDYTPLDMRPLVHFARSAKSAVAMLGAMPT
jgi:uncharacterized protein (TIGR00730 family)